MSRGEIERLRDIQAAIRAIEQHTQRVPALSGGADDPLLRDGLLFQLIVIGEAVKGLGEETKSRASEVPWADVAGLRDVIAHEYFRIDMERIRAILDRDVPNLAEAVERLLAES